MIDGRRIWLASGSVHYQRFPAESWADRLRTVARAGLNCVETPVFWNAVEARPGQFDFKGDNDIQSFIKLAGEMGLYVILRPGPFVGGGWDLGGLPAWLLDLPDVQLRAKSGPFLEAVSRYFTALAKQVRPLQATVGGPLVMVQVEHHWTCGHAELGATYLGELTRYLRESGFAVPRLNANNLWQSVEGDIDGWVGEQRLFPIMRQLGAVRPNQPRIVAEFGTKTRPVFGEPAPEPAPGVEVQRRLGEVLAGGGQFNIAPFACGTSFGFWGGQASTGAETFLAPTQDLSAAVDETGRPTDTYRYIRRIATFATSFARVLAPLEHEAPPVAGDPSAGLGATGKDARGLGWTVVPASGSQGSVVYLFAPGGKPVSTSVELVLADGSTLSVATGQQAVQWCIFDVTLSSRSMLDYSTLCALFADSDVFVCFGPAGSTGQVSINGTPIAIEVPKDRKPAVVMHEDVLVVVVNEDTADETHLGAQGVVVGAGGIDPDGTIVRGSRTKKCTLVARGGKVSSVMTVPAGDPSLPKGKKIEPAPWKAAPAAAHVEGKSPRFAQIPGPAELSQLGAPYGYGWYRVKVRSGKAKRFSLGAPEASDRVQMFLDGAPIGVLGSGPGATNKITVSFSKGDHTLVALADNMGRVSGGSDLTKRRGICGHFYELGAFKAGRASLVESEPIDLLAWKAPLFWMGQGEMTHPMRVTWSFQHRKKSPVFLEVPPVPMKTAIVVNDQPVRFIDAMAGARITLDEEAAFKRGNNTIQIAAVPNAMDDEQTDAEIKELLSAMSGTVFLEGTNQVSDTATWGFAKWETPTRTAYKDIAKTTTGKFSVPTWWRTTFDAVVDATAPVLLDLSGMTKGQVYLNGKNLGRYFVQTEGGKKVPPVAAMPLPTAWLKETGNELILFDEHGGNPGRIKIAYDA
ncbi:MAG: hypothetical protein DHS20C14_12320 [Phycisphaeraceae bacterium]|nr:MAG: hypothetical protein DHS20C14_12320 [Phycisphaeraceae bacterium]